MKLETLITYKGGFFDPTIKDRIHNELLIAMEEAVDFIETEVHERMPVGVGGTSSGLRSTLISKISKGRRLVRGKIWSEAPHVLAIEKGRTPGKMMPPKGKLLTWIVLKLGITNPESVEFPIRRSIGLRGFSTIPNGAQMFSEALTDNWDEIKRIFDKAGFNISGVLTSE